MTPQTRGNAGFTGTLCVLLSLSVQIQCIGLNDLLERAAEISERLHALSTGLTNDLDTHFPPSGRMLMPRPSLCHTSSLTTPNDKEHVLRLPESELLAIVRSLLLSWSDPLHLLSAEAPSLPHPSSGSIHSKTRELQESTHVLNRGLEKLVSKIGPGSQSLDLSPFTWRGDLGSDRNSRLLNFQFLMSCFRRDSHKIDSFLKLLRCRTAKMRPEVC
ncbi:prolactin [Lepisosteus oculatus]|uniref:prolactin n=1 Tax=Lepisosteus oculatus TaxID=7918 RepID=UPI0037210378